MRVADEVIQHLLGRVVVGDDAVAERPDHLDGPGAAAEHGLGLCADREHGAVARVHRDDRRLVQHDPLPRHVDERIGGAEVDRHVARKESGENPLEHVVGESPGNGNGRATALAAGRLPA